MKRTSGILAAAVLGVFTVATPASAQLSGLPVYASPKIGTGLTINGDFGICATNCNPSNANPQFYGGRASLAMSQFSIGLGAGIFNPDVTGADNEFNVAANAAVKVLGGPMIPLNVAVQAGVGYIELGSGDVLNIPIGVAASLNVPTPALSVEPWLMPRLQITRLSPSVGSSTTDTNFGLSGGVNLGLLTGLGFHAGFDYIVSGVGDVVNPVGDDPLTVGVGVHYTFDLPGLGMAPGM